MATFEATAADLWRLVEEPKKRGLRVLHVPAASNEFDVTSASDPTLLHRVTGFSCDCPGFVAWQRCTHHSLLLAPPKQSKTEIVPFTEPEARRFGQPIAGHPLEALFLVSLTLGLRPGEVLGLKWHDIDFKAGSLRVERTLQEVDGEWRFAPPKTERSRRVLPLPPFLVSKLRQHHKLQIAARLAATTWDPFWDLVFCTATGSLLDGRNVSRRFTRVLSDTGIAARRFYDLRHSAGTFLNAAGADPRTIMLILGHSQVSLTLNTYVHGSERLTRDAIAAVVTMLTGTD